MNFRIATLASFYSDAVARRILQIFMSKKIFLGNYGSSALPTKMKLGFPKLLGPPRKFYQYPALERLSLGIILDSIRN